MNLFIERYTDQQRHWPSSGRHILAQSDEQSVIVYQAYRQSIACFAVEHQRFGGEFSFGRMSWIKPNLLWMMYRSGWAGKAGQEHVLAIRLKRSFFDSLLERCVASSFAASGYADLAAWESAVERSDVRLQWDPDHDPSGRPLQRRALQLGLRGDALRDFAENQHLGIEDITDCVQQQRRCLLTAPDALQTPVERVYRPLQTSAAGNVGIDP